MKRKLTNPVFGLLLSVLSSCGRPLSPQGENHQIQQVSFQLKIPNSTKLSPKVATTCSYSGTEVQTFTQDLPSTLSGFNCFGVMVHYPEEGTGEHCVDPDNNLIFSPQDVFGLTGKDANDIVSLSADVKSGGNRTFYLIGMRYTGSGGCPDFKADLDSVKAYLSHPYILGKTTVDLDPGATISVSLRPDAIVSSATDLCSYNPRIIQECTGGRISLAQGSAIKFYVNFDTNTYTSASSTAYIRAGAIPPVPTSSGGNIVGGTRLIAKDYSGTTISDQDGDLQTLTFTSNLNSSPDSTAATFDADFDFLAGTNGTGGMAPVWNGDLIFTKAETLTSSDLIALSSLLNPVYPAHNIIVTPGPIDLTQTVVRDIPNNVQPYYTSGTAATVSATNQTLVFYVEPKDQYGNALDPTHQPLR